MRVCPCVLLSELNDRGIVASCEIDMCSAITMRAMNLASEEPTAVLGWNNNYGDEEDKVILFHCGPVAQGLMTAKGTVTEHKMFAKNDPGSGWGCNEGRIKAFPATISNDGCMPAKRGLRTTPLRKRSSDAAASAKSRICRIS